MHTSRFIWNGLTLRHQTVLRGSSLEPRWALVRVKRARDDDKVSAADDLSDGALDFEHGLLAVTMTGAFLPYIITGVVTAETTTDGLVVTASTRLGSLLAGLVVSFIAITLFFRSAGSALTTIHWIWLGLALAVTCIHVAQAATALKRMTAVATDLGHAA